MSDLSKTQIDRLGDRLRKGPLTDADIRLLDEYRLSFGAWYASVLDMLQRQGLSPTGRFPKTTQSIVQKLRRESVRLSQMQDIAGCRIVVADTLEQDRLAQILAANFAIASIMDRREQPSHGYRAIHVLVEEAGKTVEIQIRTSLQQLWAELSEKASDVLDPAIKYGQGPEAWQRALGAASKSVWAHEKIGNLHARAASAHQETRAAYAGLRESIEEFLKTDPPPTSAREAKERLQSLALKAKEIDVEWERTEVGFQGDHDRLVAMLRLLGSALDKRKAKTS